MNGGGGYYQAGGATAALAVQAKAPVAAWSTGLCNCFDDCGNCKSGACILPCSVGLCVPDLILTTRLCRLRDVPVPVHHVRADRGDHRPGVDVVRHQRGAVRAHHAAHGVPVRLLLLLPRQDARPVRPPGEPLRRLLRPLLLRVLRPLPGVPRAQEAGVRHEARYGTISWKNQGRRASKINLSIHSVRLVV
jgi:hypothetical protein